MTLPHRPLSNRKGSVSSSFRSGSSLAETSSSRRRHYQDPVDDDLDETAVQLRQHIDQDTKLSPFGSPNTKEKALIGSLMSRHSSRHSQSYGGPTQDGRYNIYLTQQGGNAVNVQQDLLSKDGRLGLENILQETTGWWLDCLMPNNEDMHFLVKLLRIHPLTVEDILSHEPSEKIDLFPNYTFVSLGSFEVDPETNQICPYNFYNLIFKGGLVTFHFKPSPHPDRVRHRLDQIKHDTLIVPDWIHYVLIDNVTDSFAPLVTQVEMETVSIDELSLMLHKSERFDMLKRISRCRKRTTQLSRLLTTKADVMKSLIKRYDEKWQRAGGYGAFLVDLPIEEVTALKTLNEVLLHLGDIQDHLVTMLQNISHYNRILARAHINYLASVNVDLSLTYRMTNTVMNRLTFLGTVFIPIIFVSTLWGMNVYVPGQDYKDDSWFHWILMGMIGYSALLTYFGKKWKVL